MKSLATWKLISKSLAENVPVMLLYVLESSGSSPGRQGFFMAVTAAGEMEGSIGGGIMEHKFVELAREKLGVEGWEFGIGNSGSGVIKKQVHDKSAAKNRSGMICSGEQTILLYKVEEKDTVPVQNIIASLAKHQNGTLSLSPKGISFVDSVPEKDLEFTMWSENDWAYKEKTGYKNQLFIIGGGHCALALSRLMSSMDFYIRLYDDRQELKTMVENDFVHEKTIVADYADLGPLIPSGINHFVVIMTFGYRTDGLVLKTLLDKDFKYIGLLGSKTKVEKMFDEYREEGIPEERLQRIHTPVGLAIKSQTPEEIAVSIAGEIIREKNTN